MKRKRATQQQSSNISWNGMKGVWERKELPTLYNQFIRFLFFSLYIYTKQKHLNWNEKWVIEQRLATTEAEATIESVCHGKHNIKLFLSFHSLSHSTVSEMMIEEVERMVKQMGLNIQTVWQNEKWNSSTRKNNWAVLRSLSSEWKLFKGMKLFLKIKKINFDFSKISIVKISIKYFKL